MRRALAVAVPLLIVLALVIWRAQGPAPKPATAPPSEFSATRAITVLRELLVEQVPHPFGTEANARVRERIVARFPGVREETTIQRRFVCNAAATCGTVENVIARLPGERREAVLLTAHYDSVAAGPGASDDGAGVASLLEIARAVRGERRRNPIVFLITDGEEAGLLGAEAFAADESLLREAGVVINVENRGTYGASNMFETSRNNRWLIRRLALGLDRPQATSFFYAIYDLLPNDTDVTVFKRAGKPAMNFAAIGGVNWYHSPADDLAHLSARTIQHHGDNVLAAARAFADADLATRSNDDATYFDILGFFLVWWPARTTGWLAVLSLALLMFGARKTEARAMSFGVLATFGAILLALLGGTAVSWILRMRSGGMNWVATPWPSVAAMWLTGIAAAIYAAALFRRRSDERALLFGAAIVWHAIAIVLAFTLTGASFLFLVPAMAVTICALARSNEVTIAAVASTVAALFLFPLATELYDALGNRMLTPIAILIGTMATLFAPLFAHVRVAVVVAATAIACVIVAALLPPYTKEWPRHISLTYADDPATASPTWNSGALTPEVERAARFNLANTSLTPWNRARYWSAPAPRLNIPRVEITGTRKGDHITLRVRSPRRANRIAVVFRHGTVVRVNGVAPAARSTRFRERGIWRFVSVYGAEEITVEIAAQGIVTAIGADISYGLPQEGAALARARDASRAMTNGEGDVTITRARIKL